MGLDHHSTIKPCDRGKWRDAKKEIKMPKFKIESEQGMFVITTEIEADYMEVGNKLIFKNRDANTCVHAFNNWLSVITVED